MQRKILLSLALVAMATSASAKSISQSWSINGLGASYCGTEVDDEVSLIVGVETNQLIYSIESQLYPRSDGSSDWVWLVNIYGWKYRLAERQSLIFDSRHNVPPIFYEQTSSLGYRLDEEGSGQIIDQASFYARLTPSTLISAGSWYYEWSSSGVLGEEDFWGARFEFHGFFNLPEPSILVLLLTGSVVLLRHCRPSTLLLLLCCSLLVDPKPTLATGGRLHQASGFDDHQAWSSLSGDISTDSTNHGFSIWTGDSGVTNWGLSLGASGHYGPTIFLQPKQTGEFVYESLHLVWSIVAPGPWYTTAQVTGGRILSQHADFGPLEEGDGWLAGVYITGIIMPEPTTAGLLGLGMLLLRRRQ